jgi:hypothetical protein
MTSSLWQVDANGHLVPADDAAAKVRARRKPGAFLKADVSEVRSPDQLRKYWALITKAWENQDHYATKEDLSAAALCAVGHCYRIVRPDGSVVERPKSIAFGNLPQDEFNQIFDAVAKLLAETLGVTPDALRGEAAA